MQKEEDKRNLEKKHAIRDKKDNGCIHGGAFGRKRGGRGGQNEGCRTTRQMVSGSDEGMVEQGWDRWICRQLHQTGKSRTDEIKQQSSPRREMQSRVKSIEGKGC